MLIDKEYPATHSMTTAWFAIDEDGNVAIMECDDNGPAPVGIEVDQYAPDLFEESLISKEKRIAYTDEQLLRLMSNSATPLELAEKWKDKDFSHIFDSLCEIDPAKTELLKEAASLSEMNVLHCVSPRLNLWYIDFGPPYYINENERDTIKEEANEYAKTLYKRLFTDGVLLKVVKLYFDLDRENNDKISHGYLRLADTAFSLYHQEYDDRYPSERVNDAPSDIAVHESQLSDAIRDKAIRLPLKFSEHDRIQLAAYVASYFYGSNDEWLVDGETAQIVKLPDGNFYFVGNGCYFKPIPVEDGLKSPAIRFHSSIRSEKEYRINGKRGYISDSDGTFRIIGSFQTYVPKETDIIERVNYEDYEEDDEDDDDDED